MFDIHFTHNKKEEHYLCSSSPNHIENKYTMYTPNNHLHIYGTAEIQIAVVTNPIQSRIFLTFFVDIVIHPL